MAIWVAGTSNYRYLRGSVTGKIFQKKLPIYSIDPFHLL